MSIEGIVTQLNKYNKDTNTSTPVYPITKAKNTLTDGGSNVQERLDGIPDLITTAKDEIKGGVDAAGDTLQKLYQLISAIQTLIQSDDMTLDEVQEIVNYIKANKEALTLLGGSKVNYTDIINALDTVSTVEGKVLDARAGKVLKDALDELSNTVSSLSDAVAALQSGSGSALKLYDSQPSGLDDGDIWGLIVGVDGEDE